MLIVAWRAVLVLVAAYGLAGAAAKGASLADDPLTACDRAAARAEAQWALPSHLLSAIGMVESGRRDVGGGRPLPWPWTINADGHG